VIRRRLGLQVQICDENYTNTSTKYSAGARRTSGSTHQANVGLLRYKSPQFPTVVSAGRYQTHRHEARPNQERPPASREQGSSPPRERSGRPTASQTQRVHDCAHAIGWRKPVPRSSPSCTMQALACRVAAPAERVNGSKAVGSLLVQHSSSMRR